MTFTFALLALLTLVGASAAVALRNLVHCALSLVVALAGLAALYLQLNAQFVGLAQILVYVGAVAILIVFAILLTRGGGADAAPFVSSSWLLGCGIALVVSGLLIAAVCQTPSLRREAPTAASVTTRQIGSELMTAYVLPLQVIGVLLTAAMIGAALIAMPEKQTRRGNKS